MSLLRIYIPDELGEADALDNKLSMVNGMQARLDCFQQRKHPIPPSRGSFLASLRSASCFGFPYAVSFHPEIRDFLIKPSAVSVQFRYCKRGQKAHIVAEDLKTKPNLLLLCPSCHIIFDTQLKPKLYKALYKAGAKNLPLSWKKSIYEAAA